MKNSIVRSIVLLLLAGAALVVQAKTPREIAAERYKRALVLVEDLQAVPQLELGEKQYLLAIDAFRAVHRASPASSLADDALLAVADLQAAMIDRFGADPWRAKAIDAYEYLIGEYPHSPLLGKAREASARLRDGAAPTLTQVARPEPLARAAASPAGAPNKPTAASASAAPVAPAEAILRPASTRLEPKAPPDAGQPANRAAPSPARTLSGAAAITAIRHWSTPESTRIVVDSNDFVPYKFDFLSNPRRLYFDFFSAKLSGPVARGAEVEVADTAVKKIRAGQNRVDQARVVIDLADEVFYDVSWLTNPPRFVIELRAKSAPALPAAPPDPRPAPPEVPTTYTLAESADATILAGRAPATPASFAEAFERMKTRRLDPAADVAPPVAAPVAPPVEAPVETPVEAPAEEATAPASAAPAPVELAKLTPPAAPKPALPAPPAERILGGEPPKPAASTARGSQSLIRALGLKIGRVTIDAGHGGHDTGSIGPSGLREKDVVLDISQRLGQMIESRLGAEVVYTRDADKFLSLRERTRVANAAEADLFVSVHANSSKTASVRGVETYYLNVTNDAWALDVAARENAAAEHSVHELQDLLSKIVMREKTGESRELAVRMQRTLYGGLSKTTPGLRDRGVRQAPFMVLVGAKMPAILAEIGFLSNPTDEKLLKSSKYRDQVAEFLFKGVESYIGSLSSHQVTMSEPPPAGAALD